MVAVGSVITLVVAGGASLFMAWSIGAGSSGSTPFAPAVGANAISVLRAAFFVGILGLLGATLQGGNVTEAVGRELTSGVLVTPAGAAIGLLVAGTLVAIGVRIGYPIATAFTVTGAMIGVGLALGADPAWTKYREIGALWIGTPIIGGGVAYTVARFLQREKTAERHAVPFLGGLVAIICAHIQFSSLGTSGRSASIAGTVDALVDLPPVMGVDIDLIGITAMLAVGIGLLLYWDASRDIQGAQQRFLLGLGGLVAFSAGGSQVGLAIGPLVPLLDEVAMGLTITPILFAGGIGLLAGSWTGAPRMIKALSQDYSSLSPRRSIAALIPAFGIAQTAVFFGIPVSFNEIIVSTIVGSGYAAGTSAVSRGKMTRTIAAWIASLGIAFVASYGVTIVISQSI